MANLNADLPDSVAEPRVVQVLATSRCTTTDPVALGATDPVTTTGDPATTGVTAVALTAYAAVTTRTCSSLLTAASVVADPARVTRSSQPTGFPGAFTVKLNAPDDDAVRLPTVRHEVPTNRCTTTGDAARGDTDPETTTSAPTRTVAGETCATTRVTAARCAASAGAASTGNTTTSTAIVNQRATDRT